MNLIFPYPQNLKIKITEYFHDNLNIKNFKIQNPSNIADSLLFFFILHTDCHQRNVHKSNTYTVT